jgi:ArsR family transcriptional regulator, arsenate/arsenite/antimonite-responsive transcriptional repressor
MTLPLDQPMTLSDAACSSCSAVPSVPPLPAETAAEWTQLFKALGHPVRVQIIALLSRQGGQVCVCDIEAHFTLSQPTISHHLKVLRDAGLIVSEQHGLWVYHRLNTSVIHKIEGFLSELHEG